MPKICILIPVYNEGKTIAKIVKALREKSLDVVVIDDGSLDGSGDLARNSGAIVFVNDHKMGKGDSLKKGFRYIISQGYDGVITMDGDAQHDVGDLDQFLTMAYQHSESVISGNRMADPQGMPWVRLWTNRFMSALISLACRQKVPDTQCGYRYISTKILNQMSLVSGDFEIETEILMKSSKLGYRIYSVPIKTIYQDEISHIHPLKDTLRFFKYFLRELFSRS